jgi:hypothetical protein
MGNNAISHKWFSLKSVAQSKETKKPAEAEPTQIPTIELIKNHLAIYGMAGYLLKNNLN